MIYVADGAIKIVPLQGTLSDVTEFVRLFDSAWDQIPREDRIRIGTYWRSSNEFTPAIHLWADVSLPRVWNNGHHAHFSMLVLREMHEPFSVQAIMHELAHVFFYAAGEPNHWVETGADKQAKAKASQVCEELVNQKLKEWGVDQTGLLAWRDTKEEQMRADDAANAARIMC